MIENVMLAQNIARSALVDLVEKIKPGMTELELRDLGRELIYHYGSEPSWYHGIGAQVLVGKKRSCNTPNGKAYSPTDTVLLENDIISVDITPTKNGGWGDYARNIYVRDGVASLNPFGEYRELHTLQLTLHSLLEKNLTANSTYAEVYELAEKFITANGLENLDFGGNYGHSINLRQEDRLYLVPDEKAKLSDSMAFTFEPFIRFKGGEFALKREDILTFKDGKLMRV